MKYKILKVIIFIVPLIIFFTSFFFIYKEYNLFVNVNKNTNFVSFFKLNFEKLLNFELNPNRIKSKKIDKNLYIHDNIFIDNGYILVSGYDKNFRSSTTSLFSIKNNAVIHTWIPPIAAIHKASPNFVAEYNLKKNYRMQHPLLLHNGDLVFSSGEGPLVKIDKCSNLIWANNRHFHHSIEIYNEDLIISPLVIKDNFGKEYPILNHGFALVNLDNGNIENEFSIMKILEDNKKIGLLYGVGEFEYDRIHLNDAEVIKESDKFVKSGDIMLSSKHLSTVLLYRPKTNNIIWLKTGPWLNQHDIDYLGDGKFSIFGNDTFRYNKVENHDVFLDNNNKIYIYNLYNNETTTVFDKIMKEIKTPTQGLHQILDNGDVFVEDTDNFKLVRLSSQNIRWEFFNYLGDNQIGSVHWSRYLSGNHDLSWLTNINCK